MTEHRFAHLLREYNRELDLPQPTKSRILLEIADDLQDLFTHFCADGMDEAEAQKRAEERLSPTPEILQQLREIHQSPVQRFFERLPLTLLSRWERVTLLIVLLFSVTLSALQVASNPFFQQSSEFIWPVLLAAASGFVLLLIKAYQILLKKDHSPKRIRSGVPILLFLPGAVLLLGILGMVVEFYQALLKLAQQPDIGWMLILNALLQSSALLVASLNLFLLLAIPTFALLTRIGAIEQAEASLLIAEK